MFWASCSATKRKSPDTGATVPGILNYCFDRKAMQIIPLHTPPAKELTITLFAFYDRQTTAVLKAVRAGFERDFDSTSAGQIGYPSADWLTERMSVIDKVLNERQLDQATDRIYARNKSRNRLTYSSR